MDARHPDRNALERFSRGEASVAEELWIEDHLRSGCAVCQREVDDLLLPIWPRLLRPAARGAAPGTRRRGRRLGGPVRRLEQRLALVAAERQEAPGLLAELLAILRPSGRRW